MQHLVFCEHEADGRAFVTLFRQQFPFEADLQRHYRIPRDRWATSECTRYLTKEGILTEVVDLDGVHYDISDEDLEQFIESFPVDTSALERVQ